MRNPAEKKPPQKRGMRSLRRMVLATIIGLSAVFGRAAAQNAPEKDTLTTSAPDTTVTSSSDSVSIADFMTAADTLALKNLRKDFGRAALGRQLLDFADEKKISVVYRDELTEKNRSEYDPLTNTVYLRRDLAGENLIFDFAHSLRHAWQDEVLRYPQMMEKFFTPTQRWIIGRYLEADALAFSTYYMATRQNEHIDQAQRTGLNTTVIDNLNAKTASPKGLSLRDYRKNVLEYYFSSLRAYNNEHLTRITRGISVVQNAIDQVNEKISEKDYAAAGQILDRLNAAFNAAADPAAFSDYLRRFGGLSLDPAVKTSLQDGSVLYDKLIKDYPLREKDSQTRMEFIPDLNKELIEAGRKLSELKKIVSEKTSENKMKKPWTPPPR